MRSSSPPRYSRCCRRSRTSSPSSLHRGQERGYTRPVSARTSRVPTERSIPSIAPRMTTSERGAKRVRSSAATIESGDPQRLRRTAGRENGLERDRERGARRIITIINERLEAEGASSRGSSETRDNCAASVIQCGEQRGPERINNPKCAGKKEKN